MQREKKQIGTIEMKRGEGTVFAPDPVDGTFPVFAVYEDGANVGLEIQFDDGGNPRAVI